MHLSITDFDALPQDEATALLLECCSCPRWARTVAASRPYGSRSSLFTAADAAAEQLTDDDLDDALAGHPRIGERSDNAASRREQAAVATSDADILDRIAAGNRAYEEKFGHVYLVRASGRSASELLAILERRLGNDLQTEQHEVRAALADITRLRLERLITDTPVTDTLGGHAMNTLSTHVLDATAGAPATGLQVTLTDTEGTVLCVGTTDDDGRIASIADNPLPGGAYTLTFATGDWFAVRAVENFYPEVTITFRIPDGQSHFHVPLLLSPFSYSTYRGS